MQYKHIHSTFNGFENEYHVLLSYTKQFHTSFYFTFRQKNVHFVAVFFRATKFKLLSSCILRLINDIKITQKAIASNFLWILCCLFCSFRPKPVHTKPSHHSSSLWKNSGSLITFIGCFARSACCVQSFF